jgi:hypothetical protein
MAMTKTVLPKNSGYQCPLCGTPVDTAEIVMLETGDKAVDFDCCGNYVTLQAMRDCFGVDLL